MACDFLDEDLESGYVRVLQEMIAAGWSDDTGGRPPSGTCSAAGTGCWATSRGARRSGSAGLGPFTPEEVSMLMGLPFMGAEAAILLGMDEREFPARSALRKIGALIRDAEEPR